jgi:hypothetical protein
VEILTEQPKIPPLEVRNRLLENSRRARLGMLEVAILQEELIDKLDRWIEQQRLDRSEQRKQKAIEIDR